MKTITCLYYLSVWKMLALCVFIFLFGTGYAQSGKLVLSFENSFGSEPLVFGKEYTNAHGEKFLSNSLDLTNTSKSKDSKRMAVASYQKMVAELKFLLLDFEEELKSWETDDEILNALEKKIKSNLDFLLSIMRIVERRLKNKVIISLG